MMANQGAGPGEALEAGACKLFVGGISGQTTTTVLQNHFSKYGHVIDAVVMSRDGRARGFGFVTFDSVVAAVSALSEPQWLDGRLVDVKRAVPGERVPERSTNKIFIGGLPQDVTTEALRGYFSVYGSVSDAVVMVDRRTRRSRGFGFVRFSNGPQGAQAAQAVLMDFSNHWLGGKWVEVKPATPASLLQEMAARMDRSASAAQLGARHLEARRALEAGAYAANSSAWAGKGQPLPTLLGSAAGPFPSDMSAMPSLLSSPMKVTCGGNYFGQRIPEEGFGLPTYTSPEACQRAREGR
mmetsp:Transcript_42092/g.98127  ORF Transcript_42092/g.98127 Transcript_42092/m.98127 type:complete len:297 (+) Transcript_42092:57-947(+)